MSAVCRPPKPIVEELRRVVPNCPAVGARSTADRQATQLPPQCRKLLRHPILLAVFNERLLGGEVEDSDRTAVDDAMKVYMIDIPRI